MSAMNEDPGAAGGRSDDGMPDSLPAELRRRLDAAVSDIRPAPDALDRLRAAVPARRRRRRAMVLTTVGTVAVLAVATPVVRTVVITDQTTQKSGTQADADNAQDIGDTEGNGEDDDGRDDDGQGSLGSNGSGKEDKDSRPSASAQNILPSPTGLPTFGLIPTPPAPQSSAPVGPSITPTTATATVGPTGATTAPPPPACTVNDLEQGLATALGPAGSDGIAYGVVEIRNTSRRDCSISGPGNVIVAAPPGNPPVQVSVIVHQSSDPAVRLPQVAAPTGPLTVRKGATYEFQFAWQPDTGNGGSTSCTPGDPAGPPPPVPALGYALADGGVKLADVRLTAACGGVVYRTDVYLSGAYPKA
ncbi:hypothetical protein [Yinghuangia sp. YIM S09857]|uniref:hypothetical protein n=1 Tax=Yinghuangia sp. YIM S09857 TaxID=3436929 RepID=UPI003F53528B